MAANTTPRSRTGHHWGQVKRRIGGRTVGRSTAAAMSWRTATTPEGPRAEKVCAPTVAPAWLLAPLTSIGTRPRVAPPTVVGPAPEGEVTEVLGLTWPSLSGRRGREMLCSERRYALCMDLDTRHLRALVAVVDEGSVTDAAIALRTSQASVSRSIQRLEATVGH